MIVTIFVLIRDACPTSLTSLSHSDWPRSEVMADAVSTSWVSFRSSSSIHLCYRRKPQVSVEPPRQTCQIAACLVDIMWLQRSRGSWVCYSGECVFFICVFYCAIFGLGLTYYGKDSLNIDTVSYGSLLEKTASKKQNCSCSRNRKHILSWRIQNK